MSQPHNDVPFWRSQTTRLTAVYLSIMMVMSIAFSTIIYMTSAGAFDRRFPDEIFIDSTGSYHQLPRFDSYVSERSADAKRELFIRLVVLNIIMMLFGLAISYILARKTLEPIEENSEAQARFVSDVSHELRTPLASMQITNEVVLRRKKLSLKEARETLSANLDDVTRLQRMITTMLELLSDRRGVTLADTRLHDIVPLALTQVAPSAIDRSITIDDETINFTLRADADSLAQVLVVLLDNAIKYSPEHSRIRLTSRRSRNRILIAVVDEGVGIPESERGQIFERFYRSDKARARSETGGYGLGLPIAQRIVEAHGGRIDVAANPSGVGSQFTIVLPRVD